MAPHHELTRVVADHHRVGQEAVRLDGAPERSFGGDAHRIGADLQIGDTKPLKMAHPGGLVREGVLRMRGQPLNDRPGQGTVTHVGQRLGIDHVVCMAGASALIT
jgi:hypothetical protein